MNSSRCGQLRSGSEVELCASFGIPESHPENRILLQARRATGASRSYRCTRSTERSVSPMLLSCGLENYTLLTLRVEFKKANLDGVPTGPILAGFLTSRRRKRDASPKTDLGKGGARALGGFAPIRSWERGTGMLPIVRHLATCRRYPWCLGCRARNSGARTHQPVGWDKEDFCVSRTPFEWAGLGLGADSRRTGRLSAGGAEMKIQ